MKAIEDMTEPELRDLTRQLLNCIKDRLPSGTQFALLYWPPGLHKVCQYGSNCERAGMIQGLREAADRLEKRQDTPR